MLSKAEAGYRAPDHRCPYVMCRRFEAYLGACSLVGAGSVLPDATCDHWRTVEVAMTDEQRGFA
jgi:hypothetical protein